MSLEHKGLTEARELLPLLRGLPRSKSQQNAPFESDAELLNVSGLTLATTIDSIGEEIQCGLYSDWHLAGWMSAVVSLSDLSAVSATPLGLLVSTQWKYGTATSQRQAFYKGLRAMLKTAQVPLLGGDSGSSAATDVSSVGLGLCSYGATTRVGAQPGDLIVTTAPVGRGAAFALHWLLDSPHMQVRYRPVPFLGHEKLTQQIASSVIDTSDGLMTSLCHLMRLNGVSAEVELSRGLFDRGAVRWAIAQGLPDLALLFAEHGDYQLLMTVRERSWTKLKPSLRGLFLPVGRILPAGRPFAFSLKQGRHEFNPGFVADVSPRERSEILSLFKDLVRELTQVGVAGWR